MNGVILLSLFSINAPAVVSETIEGETVAVNLETGCYYSMTGTAALLWTLMDKGLTLEAMEDLLVAKGLAEKGKIHQSLEDFFGKLLEKELVTESQTSDDAPPAADEDPRKLIAGISAFTEPELEEFTEMQEMLLLDPIHEVDKTGWPNVMEQE